MVLYEGDVVTNNSNVLSFHATSYDYISISVFQFKSQRRFQATVPVGKIDSLSRDSE